MGMQPFHGPEALAFISEIIIAFFVSVKYITAILQPLGVEYTLG
jgi:hypothetical protein